MKFVFHIRPLPAWCWSPTTKAADSCTLYNLFPFEWWQISLPKCRIVKFYTAWASIGGGRGDHVPPLFSLRGQHRKCSPLFQFIKTNLQAYSEADHSPLLKILHRSSSSDINFRLPGGKLLDKLLGWPQIDLSSVNIHHPWSSPSTVMKPCSASVQVSPTWNETMTALYCFTFVLLQPMASSMEYCVTQINTQRPTARIS